MAVDLLENRSKRYKKRRAGIEEGKFYTPAKAVRILKQIPDSKYKLKYLFYLLLFCLHFEDNQE